MCRWITGRERVNSSEALYRSERRRLPVVSSRRHARFWCDTKLRHGVHSDGHGTDGKYQWDDRAASDADQDVLDEPFNKHSWSDDENTENVYSEIDELVATSVRAMKTTIGGKRGREGAILSEQ